MHVTSTELQNNFGKYLMLAAREDIIITKNGREVGRLTAGAPILEQKKVIDDVIAEEAEDYLVLDGDFGGREATYEEFLALTEGREDTRFEYIDGEIYLLAAPKANHQAALSELFGVFFNWFQGKKCRPFVAPFDITLKRVKKSGKEDINVVQPDLIAVCDYEEKLAKNGYYMGVPALLVEILSESTRRKDMLKKLNLYMYCGVEEYWVVDPVPRTITVYRLKDRDIVDHNTHRLGDTAHSFRFEGLSVQVSQVFR